MKILNTESYLVVHQKALLIVLSRISPSSLKGDQVLGASLTDNPHSAVLCDDLYQKAPAQGARDEEVLQIALKGNLLQEVLPGRHTLEDPHGAHHLEAPREAHQGALHREVPLLALHL